MDSTPIQKFYEGKTIFLTGVTGFVGKVLVEKLLRCCPGISRIYLLLREKRGKTTNQRLEQLFSSELFRVLKKANPNFLEKVSIVNGDLSHSTLDISEDDNMKLKNEVNIVFHVAGRVKWDNELKIYAQVHLIATSVLLEMAKCFTNIEAFVHVSTASVHRDPDFTVPNRIVKQHVSPKQLLDALEWMDDDTARSIVPLITEKHDHIAYSLTKALAENILEENHGNMPLAIVRLVYVIPTYKDPFPGFCDTLQSLQSFAFAIAKGIIKAAYIHPNMKLPVIPVDVTANTLIAAAWHVNQLKKKEEVLVVNCALPGEKEPLVDEPTIDFFLSVIRKYALAKFYRYPNFTLHRSFFWFRVHHFFVHYIYVVLIDIYFLIFTGKPWVIRLYNRMYALFDQIYLNIFKNPFISKLDTYNTLRDQLSKGDEEIFFMDTSDFDFKKTVEDSFIVMRKLVMKEDPSNISYAKRKQAMWWFVTSAVKWIIILCILQYMYSLIFN